MSEQKHDTEDELKTLLATLWKNTIAPHKANKEESFGMLDTIVSISAQAPKKPAAPISSTESQQTFASFSAKPKPPSASGSHLATVVESGTGPSGTKVAGPSGTKVASGTARGTSTKKAQSTFVAAEKLASVSASRLSVMQKHVVDAADPTMQEEGTEYEIVRVLGQGGMGVVYEARQTALDRSIALKMIKSTAAQDQDSQAVFLAEAAVTGELEHPGVVPVYDLGIQADGMLFYAMKQVKGVPWNKVLNKKSVQENIEVLLKIADAVAFAHAKGIIHRDLKPENVMLGEFGEVLLMDWGLAASVVDGGKTGRLTAANAAGGTPAYMAPEMATGNVELIGYRSDVYLLGAILYEIVTALRPHTGKDMMTVLYNIATNVIQQTDKKGELVDIAVKAMSTQPEERYASIKDFQAAIKDSQKHFESITLADKAGEHLEKANKTKVYDDYAQALFGYQQALEMWEANRAAHVGVKETRLAYTRRAIEQADIDLASSLIEPVKADYPHVLDEIAEMRRDREAKRKRLRVLTYGSAGLAAFILIGVTVAYFLVSAQKERALVAKKDAEFQRNKADDARKEAEENAERAREAQKDADASALIARSNEEKAKESEKHAKESERLAKENFDKLQKAVNEVLQARGEAKEAMTTAEMAEKLKKDAQKAELEAKEKLERTGELLEASDKWIFDAAGAKDRQAKAAEQLGKPALLELALPQGQKLALLAVPAGNFIMGTPAKEANRMSEEYLHTVTITKPYYMAKYELSVAQWKAITGTEPPVPDVSSPSPNHPVTNINCKDVDQLLAKLKALAPEGFEFRLPTEAEWEWACRAGTNTPFCDGESKADLEKVAFFRFNSSGGVHDVGTLAPNQFGLYDMHGNVSELCRDYYDPSFYLKGEKQDPLNEQAEKFRVARGGGWVNLPQHVRSAYRSYVHVENRYDFLGIRVVLAKVDKPKTK
ncbi:MAG: SUMF1/EgtB/PvdO family nonheme iron enzyme [Planctomycetes bacterium]|nr:SUMF1/EgtB/PvdO family nonheme iron enzyme [Planctomycetota bacterium]